MNASHVNKIPIVVAVLVAVTFLPADSRRSPKAILDAHIEYVFAAVSSEDAMQLEADRRRVRDVHKLAELVERFRRQAGRYPLSDRASMQNAVIKNSKSRHGPPRIRKYNVSAAVFLEELRSVLGKAVVLPVDKIRAPKQGSIDYAYSFFREEYVVASYLVHPVKFAQSFGPHMHQYRVGSKEKMAGVTVLKYSKVIEGGYLPAGARRESR